ncbi:hypothetical protein CFBP8129_36350 [Xanthomonas hortorum pv. gardneri]|uniref:Uncharacterized protein n=1 Tax=Xanthomonas hortorum pv. gardneri TaxID=2754056 RepID=A0A6V7EI21_9XANT|nr:hypothetical protein CFBP2044_35870 [Xanthomonas hortorum pv. cynarae]CAD0350458.1 hypothetical protein CFBP2044_35870 [Xanthomonas hortorum pv. cynarae]CAD0350885.1 hypothetical protein CFBP8129_36350 [Xanthomonas hortorum pv. gardneri]CAD0350891.1 hypothetical protein CFBP8129_36350 [Xanthomonas hortorum pv. gardneri]
MDVLAACPASGEGTAPSTNKASQQSHNAMIRKLVILS